MEEMKYVAVDIETNYLDFNKGDIKFISLYSKDDYSIVDENILKVKDVLEDSDVIKVFHNIIFDVSWLIL
ncbi:hypothetical protein [Clostridioides difficile]|uniref:hypothetical protein n=1 Tax=Clostridioides difficile TaxID=1496 RepID=UPI0022393F88|nr:hypothetical protein [Clostridioides difficile]MDL0353360.1 hypothetical protein [Clostridioides difficile]